MRKFCHGTGHFSYNIYENSDACFIAYYQCLMQSKVSKLVSYNVYFHQSIHTYNKRITINITVSCSFTMQV